MELLRHPFVFDGFTVIVIKGDQSTFFFFFRCCQMQQPYKHLFYRCTILIFVQPRQIPDNFLLLMADAGKINNNLALLNRSL